MAALTKPQAEKILREKFGFSSFHPLQWEVIDNILKGKRTLLIEKTGFGKSLCYQFPATVMEGLIIVFSPLIALMRDQVRSMEEKGIRVASINSGATQEENAEVIHSALSNQLDLLYIAPERMENAEWISAAREMKIAMIVIDEAHGISQWGQSFRPNYRRIVNLVSLLPKTFPVLAVTATATPRVEADIKTQIGDDFISIRGNLLRPNIRLTVIRVSSEDEKFLWLAGYFDKLPKTGIIYTGTQTNTELFSNWMQFLGHKSAAYSGRLDSETRKSVEEKFMNNEYDCVVSTNALGMGIDKPDIRFIIHTQMTQSPVQYYQEIGRAGRDGKESYAILFYNPVKDHELPLAFINSSKPDISKYNKVIAAVKKELLGQHDLIRRTNLKRTELTVILADLIDQKIVTPFEGKSKKYFYNSDAGKLDFSGFEQFKSAQMEDFHKMVEYVNHSGCRMQYLCSYLGDTLTGNCSICDNDRGAAKPFLPNEQSREKLVKFRETYFPLLTVTSQKSNIINGVAASYYGISNVGEAIHRSKYENGGNFPDWLLALTIKAFRKQFKDVLFHYILYIPPTKSGDLVKSFAEKLSAELNIPLLHDLIKTRTTTEQKIFQSVISKKDNVKNAFTCTNPQMIEGKNILLFDDIFDSGTTIKEVGRMLTGLGAHLIAPLTIAKTVGGDISDGGDD